MQDVDILTRKFERERKARMAAELILEDKSREVFEANEELTRVAGDLRNEMEKSQAILDHAAEGIVTIDQEGKIRSFNPAAANIFELNKQDAIGQKFSKLLPNFSTSNCTEIIDNGGFGPEEVIGIKGCEMEFVMEMTISVITSYSEPLLIAIIRDRTKRKQLEAQLSLAQKMESVGQLAAGIAHEINTPIQFVGDNVRFLSEAFEDIESLMDAYERLTQESEKFRSDETIYTEIQSKKTDADMDFVLSEIPMAIEQSKIGIQRVATIVTAMKEFSHPGTSEATAVDINAALESTITVSRNEWRYVANLETDFQKNLPLVLGFAGDLNQAFLNIIINAAHAIEQHNEGTADMGTIRISTRQVDSNSIEVRIADSGCGIPADKQAKIFEPFFTTKAVGKGTGQGLAIVHQVIVEKHFGQIDIESAPGEGTQFVISVPIDPETPNLSWTI